MVILCNMILICSPYESPILFQIDLHNAQSWGMVRCMVERDALAKIKAITSEGLPLQLGQIHVVSKVDSRISSCPDSPAGILELFFVDVDWDVGACSATFSWIRA